MTKISKTVLLYILICLIWGTTWVVLKKSIMEGTPAIFGVGLRFLLSGLIIFFIVKLKKIHTPKTDIAMRIYLLFGLFNFVIGYGATYWASQFIYSNLASLLWAGFPIVTVLMSHFYLPDEKITTSKLFSILTGTTGVIIILSQSFALSGKNVTLGMLVIVVAIFFASISNVYLKKYNHEVDTFSLNMVSQISAGLILLIISSFVEKEQQMIWSSFNIFALIYLTIFGTIIAWLVYVWLFKHISMARIAYIAFPPPVIASILGWKFLSETLSPVIIFGAALVLLGAVMVNLKK